jgi:hypothetical protein
VRRPAARRRRAARRRPAAARAMMLSVLLLVLAAATAGGCASRWTDGPTHTPQTVPTIRVRNQDSLSPWPDSSSGIHTILIGDGQDTSEQIQAMALAGEAPDFICKRQASPSRCMTVLHAARARPRQCSSLVLTPHSSLVRVRWRVGINPAVQGVVACGGQSTPPTLCRRSTSRSRTTQPTTIIVSQHEPAIIVSQID